MTFHPSSRRISTLQSSVELLKVISEFSERLGGAPDLGQLGEAIVTNFSRQARLPQAALWVCEAEGDHYRLIASHGQDNPSTMLPLLTGDHPLVHSLAGKGSVLHPFQSAVALGGQTLTATQAVLCLAFRKGTTLLGVCILGPIDRGCENSEMDEDQKALIETMARIASVNLDHSLSQDHLRRSSTLMRRTDRLRSLEIMAGGFAHEIRNPLTSIKTFVQLAPQRQQDPVFIKEFSKLALEDIHRIERLLHEILDYASYMTPKPVEVDLNEVVASCIGFVSATAARRNIDLQTLLSPQLPLLLLDRQQIKQVLLNLLLNALDAMPTGTGTIRIHTRLLPQTGRTPWVQLQVADEGCGITPNHLEHIFDPFFTTKHSNSAGDGAGLGLTTAHQIVREHGGTLTVESRVGAGSTFSVNLPVPDGGATGSAVRE
ncbi:MAG: hypothetical protein JSR62_07165 [Nitrospira sp.]|nr:hypothetical protein [Nitrospira sp.]